MRKKTTSILPTNIKTNQTIIPKEEGKWKNTTSNYKEK